MPVSRSLPDFPAGCSHDGVAGGSVFDGEPAPMGETLTDLSPDDDLLEEMLPGTAS